jgi:hypothetical protein
VKSEIFNRNQPEIPNRAIRLTFSYEGGRIELKSRKALITRTPPSASFTVHERESGFWFQVQDANGNLIYRKVMDDPIKFDIETISDQDPERPFTRIPVSKPQGIFFILVPLFHEAQTIHIFSSPFEPERRNEPAKKIMTFGLLSADRDVSSSSDYSQNSDSDSLQSPGEQSNPSSDVRNLRDNMNNNSGGHSSNHSSNKKSYSGKRRGK